MVARERVQERENKYRRQRRATDSEYLERRRELARNWAKQKYASNAEWREQQLKDSREYQRQKYASDESYREKQRFYNKSHRKESAARRIERYREDPVYRLRAILRARLHDAIKNNFKAGSAVRDLGCTIPELKAYIEAQFQPGMTWENWGFRTWHIDHIKPLDAFDLTNREQLLQACHYTNLQPMWAKENLSKGPR